MADSGMQDGKCLFSDELFRQVPVCLWVEDFSAVYAIIENLKSNGVSDFPGYFLENPTIITECAEAVRVIGVNRATVQFHKAENHQQLLNNIPQTFTAASSEVFSREVLGFINNDSSFSADTELCTLDGDVLDCVIKAFVDPEFECWSRVYVAITDISPIKKVERALRRSEAHFRDLYDQAPTGYQSLDAEGKFLNVNQTMLELLGFEREELIGKWFGEFLVSEEQDVFRKKFPIFIELGRVQGVKFSIMNKDGSVIHVEFDGRTETDPDGGFLKTHCVMRDITNQKAAEEARDMLSRQNELILLAAGDGILGINQSGKIDFVNPAAERITGWTAFELLGKSEHEILHHTDNEGMAVPKENCPILIPVNEGRATQGKSLFWRKDGSSFSIDFNCQPLLSDGVIEGSVLTFRDISERESLENQVALSQKLEAVGHLAGGLAHDFNNILQVMIGEAELALDGQSNYMECRQSLKSIKKGILKASGLTRQLLAFGRCQVLDKKAEKIDDLVENILRMLRRLVPEDVEISFHAGGSDCSIFVDVGQIEQVLVNLCINARDAMPNGGRLKLETGVMIMDELFIKVHPWARLGEFVEITVSDTGFGMSHEIMAQIFEPFFTTKAEDSGTGLGLSTAYGIIKQHDGFIHVYSEQEIGTTFRIYLPVSARGEGLKNEKMALKEAVGGSETILIAEDDSKVRDGFCRILEQVGYKVLTAENGLEALELINSKGDDIQLIVLDVIMPKLSGPEVLDRIRQGGNNLPVIFCSGYSRDLFDEELLKNEEIVLLNKPISGHLLLSKIRELLTISNP